MIIIECGLFGSYILLRLYCNKNKLDIALLFYIYWFFFLSIGVIGYQKIYPISNKCIMWIIFVCILFDLGYYIGKKCRLGKRKIYKISFSPYCEKNITIKLFSFLRFCFASVVIYKLVFTFLSGNIVSLFSPKALLETFSNYRDIKYGIEESNVSIGGIGRLFDFLYFPAIYLLGYRYKLFLKEQKKILTVLFLISVFLSTITDGAKSTVIFSLVLFFAGFIVDSMYKGGIAIKKVNYKLIFVIVAVFLVSMQILMGKSKSDFFTYGFGEIPAFNSFFNTYDGKLTYGKQTFYGIVRLLSPGTMFSGNETNYSLPSNINILTNIYTAFRCSITDFGVIGGGLFYFFMGGISGLCISNIKKELISFSILGWILGYIMLSFLISIGYYFTISISFILAAVYLFMIKKTNFKIIKNSMR